MDIDTKKFNDELAEEINWSPVSNIQGGICSRRLNQVGPNRLAFRPTLPMWMFALVFIVFGILILYLSFRVEFQGVTPVLAAAIFLVIGTVLVYVNLVPAVLDKQEGWYWKGWKSPAHTMNPGKNAAKLNQVHAIQLLCKIGVRPGSNNRGHRHQPLEAYELNLVMRDTSRLNVICHGNLAKIREDARLMSRFLGKPLWDVADKPVN